ncbi:tadC protein [Bifidobacterium callimiconis]|nr:tadC protein [Bifidobacterium callimiconis]
MTTELWAFAAAMTATITVYLCVAGTRWAPLVGEGSGERRIRTAVALVLEMIAVAVRQGASIPRALEVIGGVCSRAGGCGGGVGGAGGFGDRGGNAIDDVGLDDRGSAGHGSGRGAGGDGHDLGREMIRVARALNRGADWDNAWGVADPDGPDAAALAVIRSALEPSWKHGISPLLRIETTIEQIDRDERQRIEEAAAKLSVRVLVPMGLCFLPAFILIGVIPSIISFATG